MCPSLIRLREILLDIQVLRPGQFPEHQSQLSLDRILDRLGKLPAWWDVTKPALNQYQIEVINAEQTSGFRDLDRKLAIGDHLVLGRLGMGGMAEVFRAFSIRHTSVVAIKQPLRNDQYMTERLRAEAEVMMNLDHPAIARCYSINNDARDRDRCFMIMECVEGQSLRQTLKVSRRPVAFEAAQRIAFDVTSAIAYAHSQEIVHRDITSANIMLTNAGQTKVLDFGFAKELASMGQTVTGTILGTPQYMSPEHFDDAKGVRPASDVYSLGCVFYELLVGQPPFTGSFVGLCKKHCTEVPVAPAERNPAIPAQWNDAIVRSLSKSPTERGTAEELGEAFNHRSVPLANTKPSVSAGRKFPRVVPAQSSEHVSLQIPAMSITAEVFGHESADWAARISRRLAQNAVSRPALHLLSRLAEGKRIRKSALK